MNIQIIKEEVTKLDRIAQAELMHFMIELLANNNLELSKSWKNEINRREKALDNGTSIGRPAKEVIAKYLSKQ